ncbi:MAG: signal recognition particle-docking protein FtsY [Nanoarchaeota archaeon]
MFKFLKEKLKSWTEKIAKHEEIEKEKPEKVGKKTKEKPEKIEEKIYDNLKKKADKIKKIVHLEPSLDKQLRGETIGEGLKNLEETEEAKPGTQSFFQKITARISKVKISEKEFSVYSEELENLLLENNVAFEVAEKIIGELKKRMVGKELLKKEVEEDIKDSLRDIIEEILIKPFDLVEKIKLKDEKPYVILFCGINGSGKTTTVAKIADFLKRKKISCVLAAADTFRAASIEQLKKHGEKIGVKIISHDYGSDPASVGFDAVQYAKKNHVDCVLIDTAGRMHTAKNLLKEIEKISKVCKPDTKIFVGESITGNDAIEQVKSFDLAIGINAIILTKSDIDEKGGTALSVGYVTRKPILFLGTGQEYDAIEVFDKRKFVERLGL